ncbi:MAG: DUF3638 domain-containing protein, partial [Parachlamydiaceae bacterium]|nr:DUF3638 domain-containing protein [Parachlamydiaceae bacterium]
MELEQFDMASNMFWIAATVQKYVDFASEKGEKKGLAPLSPVIDKDLIFKIINNVSNQKYKSQWAVVFEAVLASCTHLVKSPIDLNGPDEAFLKKIMGRAWAAHIIRKQTQIKANNWPRNEDADRFILFLNRFLSEATPGVLENDVLEIVNRSIAPSLANLYPNLSQIKFIYKAGQQDVFESENGTTIGLIAGGLSSTNKSLLSVYDQPLPTWAIGYLKLNHFYPDSEDIDQLRCYFSGTSIYIQDKKNGLELYLPDEGNNQKSIFIKFPWSNNEFLPRIDNRQENYELRKFHQFSSSNCTYFCDAHFKLTHQGLNENHEFGAVNKAIFKIKENGTLDLGAKLVELPVTNSLFSSFEDPHCTLTWADEQGKLNEIEFPRLNINFKQTDEGQWEFSQQKGWYLAQEQYTPHFGQKTGFLVLENMEGKKKVLFPVWDFKKIEVKRSLNFPVEYEFNGENLREGHYVECTVEGSQLIPKSLEARFYLACIFLEKGRLDEAEKLLFAIEADPSHKSFSAKEQVLLETIIFSKQSKDSGSRTLRMQVRAAYLLKRNQAQFPVKGSQPNPNSPDLQIGTLMEEYVQRLGHIQALDSREELLILQKMSNLSIRLEVRRTELIDVTPQTAEGFSIAPTPLLSKMSKVVTKRPENIAWPASDQAFKILKVNLKDKFTYQRCRMANTFPFDPKNPDIKVLKRYLPLMSKECLRKISWEKACQNGLVQTLYALLLFTENGEFQIRAEVLKCLSSIEQPNKNSSRSHPPSARVKTNTSKKISPIQKTEKIIQPSTPNPSSLQSLIVLNEIKAPKNENIFLPILAEKYLEPIRAQTFSVSESVFAANAIESVDDTIKKQFEYCRKEIATAQDVREDFNYRIKNDMDYALLEFELKQSIAEQAQTLVIHERVIIGALSSALRSDPLSDLSFISKNRKLPSMQEICIFCSKKNRDTYLKELFPEISPEGLIILKEAVKNYLVEKQFLQHLKRALIQANDVLRAPCSTAQEREAKGMLEDALGRTLVSKRAYALDNVKEEDNLNAMVFLQLETLLDIKFRKDQIKNIKELIDATENDKEVVLQMIMGAGKTSILQPLLGFLLAKPEALSAVIVPSALFEPVKEGLANVLGEAFHIFVTCMDYNRELAQDREYLKTFLDTINDAKARGSTFLFEPCQKQSLITSLYEIYDEVRNNPNDPDLKLRKATIMEICQFLQLSEVDQVDEIDMVYNPQVTFKYPIGTRSVVDTEKASLLSDIILSLASDSEISDTISLDFIEKFKIRKGDKISEKSVGLNKDLLSSIVQPKLAQKAIAHLRKKSVEIDLLFTNSDSVIKNAAELYFPHFLMGTTPLDEKIQAQCLLVDEAEIYNSLKDEDPDIIKTFAKSLPVTNKSLIAKKIRFQNKMRTWIEKNVRDSRNLNLIGACGIAITQILPKSLNKPCGSEYGEDPKKGRYVARPYNAPESPKTTMFATPEEQVIYSTQQTLYYGIPLTEAEQILKKYQVQAKEEMQTNNKLPMETYAYQTILKCFGGNLSDFNFLSPLSEEFIKAFQEKASQDKEIISLYLRTYVYPQIAEYSQSLSCSAQALGGSSKLQCGYTGTMHVGVLTRTQKATFEEGTNGKTISAVQSKMESGIAITEVIDDPSPSSAIIERFKNDPNLFVFIDSGGWLKEEKIHDYAAKLLTECRETRKDLEGIVYHDKDGTIVSLELDKSDPSKKTFVKVPMALSRLKTTSGSTLTIIGQKYDIGTNITQKANAKAYMSVRKDMTLRDAL